MKFSPALVHTIRIILRLGGKSDLTSEDSERSMTSVIFGVTGHTERFRRITMHFLIIVAFFALIDIEYGATQKCYHGYLGNHFFTENSLILAYILTKEG